MLAVMTFSGVLNNNVTCSRVVTVGFSVQLCSSLRRKLVCKALQCEKVKKTTMSWDLAPLDPEISHMRKLG